MFTDTRRRARPHLEVLEDRLAPAFDVLISSVAEGTQNVSHDAAGNFVATGPGAIIFPFDIRSDLLAGKTVRISTGAGGNQAGNITWDANLADLDFNGIGRGRLILEVDPSATVGNITLGAKIHDSVPGLDALDLTVRTPGDLVVAADLRVGVGSVELAADVRPDGAGHDGAGTLTVAGGVTVAGGAVTLRGADVAIDGAVSAADAAPQVVASGFLGNFLALAFDADGDLYVADIAANSVSKVTRAGVVTPFGAGFNKPAGLAFDADGNLFVANFGGNSVTKLDRNGQTVATFTGFSFPFGLAFDPDGNLHVANFGSNRVSKVTPGGVTFLAPEFQAPRGLAFDARGNLYVAETPLNLVSRVTPDGVVSIFATGFDIPTGLAFDEVGNLYVADNGLTASISQVTPDGVVSPVAVGLGGGVGGSVGASGVAVDGGLLYTADDGGTSVSRLLTEPGIVRVRSSLSSRPIQVGAGAAGGLMLSPAELARLDAPRGLTLGDGAQTGPITFTAADLVGLTTSQFLVQQDPEGAGQIVLEDGAAPALAARVPVRFAAGTGGIVAARGGNGIPEIATIAPVELKTAGPVGSAANRIQFPLTASSVSVLDASAVFLDGLGDLTLGTVNAVTLDVTARGDLTVAGLVTTFGSIFLAADTRPDRVGDDGTGTLTVAEMVAGSEATLRGADVRIDAAVNAAAILVRPSLADLRITVGAAEQGGLTLDQDELSRFNAADSLTLGGGAQIGDVTFGEAILTVPLVRVEQSADGPGRILFLGARSLTASGTLVLAAGAAGVEADVPGAGLAAATLLLDTPGDVGSPVRPLVVEAATLGAGRVGGGLFLIVLDDLTTASVISVGGTAELTFVGDFRTQAGHLAAPVVNLSFIGADFQLLESGGQVFRSLVHAGPGPFQLADSLTLTGSLVNISGRFDGRREAVSVGGLTSILGGEYLAGDRRAHTFAGGLLIEGAFEADDSPVVAGSVTLGVGGVLEAPSGTLTVTGDWTNLGGVFDAHGGTVVLAGVNQRLSGDTTFHNLSKTAAGPDTLIFEAGSTQTVLGTLTLQGAAGPLLSLRSSVAGTPWDLDPQGDRSVSFVDVQDSHNVNSRPVDAPTGRDSGRNVNWSLPINIPTNPTPPTPIPSDLAPLVGDVTSLVRATFIRLRGRGFRRRLRQVNTGAAPLAAPLTVLLSRLPTGVRLPRSGGTVGKGKAKQFFVVLRLAGPLQPGQTAEIDLRFSATPGPRLRVVRVVAGTDAP